MNEKLQLLEDYDPQELELVAYHEAGHYVASRYLGGVLPTRITIIPTQFYKGCVEGNLDLDLKLAQSRWADDHDIVRFRRNVCRICIHALAGQLTTTLNLELTWEGTELDDADVQEGLGQAFGGNAAFDIHDKLSALTVQLLDYATSRRAIKYTADYLIKYLDLNTERMAELDAAVRKLLGKNLSKWSNRLDKEIESLVQKYSDLPVP